MAKYTALQVAHWFIYHNQIIVEDMGAEKMTLLKLLKLLYYAEGCYLAINDGESLFDEKILAWEHGPVIEKEDESLLEQVFKVFGQYSAWALRNKTHEETPWLEATGNGQYLNGEISRRIMMGYFKDNYIAA